MKTCVGLKSIYVYIASNKVKVARCNLNLGGEFREYSFEEWKNIDDLYSELSKYVNTFFNKKHEKLCPKDVQCYSDEKLELEQVHVSMDYSCNLNCNFCHNEHTTKYSEIYYNTLEKLKNSKLYGIRLTDCGEPLFYKNRIYNYIKTCTFKYITIQTNGTLISDDLIELFKERQDINFNISISLNAGTPERYLQRTGKNYFDKVVIFAEKLKKYKNIYVHFTSVDDGQENNNKFFELSKKLDIPATIIPYID